MEGAYNQVLDLHPQCRTLVHTPGWIVRDCKMKSGMWLKNASVRTCSNDPVTTDVCNTRQYVHPWWQDHCLVHSTSHHPFALSYQDGSGCDKATRHARGNTAMQHIIALHACTYTSFLPLFRGRLCCLEKWTVILKVSLDKSVCMYEYTAMFG